MARSIRAAFSRTMPLLPVVQQTLLISAVLLLLNGSDAMATTVSWGTESPVRAKDQISPDITDDSLTYQGNPNENYGDMNQLQVGTTGGDDVNSYLYAEIPNLSDIDLETVNLHIYAYLTGHTAIILAPITENWDESSITWNNQPNVSLPDAVGPFLLEDLNSVWVRFEDLPLSWFDDWKGIAILPWGNTDIGNFGSSESSREPFLSVEFTGGLPDLVVDDPIAPSVVNIGDGAGVYCEVVNQGEGEAETSYVGYYVNDSPAFNGNEIYLGRSSCGSLDPGERTAETRTVQIPDSLDPLNNPHYILFKADYDDRVNESDEYNNTEFVEVEVIREEYTISGTAASDNSYDHFYGCEVRLTDSGGTVVSEMTGYDGGYSFDNVAPGNYTLSVHYQPVIWDQHSYDLNVTSDTVRDFTGHCRAHPEVTITAGNYFYPGEPYYIDVSARNVGANVSALTLWLDVSFPGFAGSAAPVVVEQVNNLDGDPTFYYAGSGITVWDMDNGSSESGVPASYLLVSGSRTGSLDWGDEWGFTLRVDPPDDADIPFLVKASILDSRDPDQSGDGVTIGQQGLFEFSHTATSGISQLYSQTFMEIDAGGETATIYAITDLPDPDLGSRAFSEIDDAENLESIYIENSAGEIFDVPSAAQLLYKAQSARKYAAGQDVAVQGALRANIVQFGGIVRQDRDPILEDPYSIYVPTDVAGWWREMFMMTWLDTYVLRRERYGEVIFDMVLQPGIADNVSTNGEVLGKLSEYLGTLNDVVSDPVINAIRTGDSLFEIPKNSAEAILFHWLEHGQEMAATANELKFLERTMDVLGLVGQLAGIQAEAMQNLLLHALASGAAQDRLEGLGRALANTPDLDPAILEGYTIALQDFYEIVEVEYYGELDALIEASLDGTVLNWQWYAETLRDLLPAAAQQALLPWFLSWEVFSSIRDQSHAAQHLACAATIFHLLVNDSGRFEALSSEVSGIQVDYLAINELVSIVDIACYAAWYTYDRYYDISTNAFIDVFGPIEAALGLPDADAYMQYLAALDDERQIGENLWETATDPFYLARHRGVLDPTAEDDEALFLWGRLVDEEPEMIAYLTNLSPEFTAAPAEGIRPLTVQLTNTSPEGYTAVHWDLGDGYESVSESFTHEYPAFGEYFVRMTLTDGYREAVSDPVRIVVEPQPIVADFVVNQESGSAPHTVQFTNLTSGDFSAFSWSFGDGSSSTDPNPQHTYENPGLYTVTLSASGEGGSNTRVQNELVEVIGPTASVTVYANTSEASYRLIGPVSRFGGGTETLFDGLPPGEYEFIPTTIEGVLPVESSTFVLNEGDAIEQHVEYRCSVIGDVYDENSSPLEGVVLGGFEENVVSNELGEFVGTVSYGSDLTIEPSLEGYNFVPPTVELTSIESAVVGVEFEGRLSTLAILLSVQEIAIGEGETGSFAVVLNEQPPSTVSVEVARISGDEDIVVESGAQLQFTVSNWQQTQSVVLRALEDEDQDHGVAEIGVNGVAGPAIIGSTLIATEVDSDVPTDHWISGTVRDPRGQRIDDVVMVGLPGDPGVNPEDGTYGVIVPDCWSGTVTPVRDLVEFLPIARSYECVSADQLEQDYVGTVPGILDCATLQVYGDDGGAETPYSSLLVTVEGTVYVVPGTYSSGGGYLVDSTGGLNYYFDEPPAFGIGDVVRMEGYVWWDANCEIYLGMPQIEIIGHDDDLQPTRVGIAELVSDFGYVGSFVEVLGWVVHAGVLEGGEEYVTLSDDESEIVVYADPDTDVNLSEINIGESWGVAGPAMNFCGEIRMSPRFQSDLMLHPVGVEDLPVPTELAIRNHPNPFNPMTAINYELPESGSVTLSIYDMKGRFVCDLVHNENKQAGRYSVTWQGKDSAGRTVATGVYFCRIQVGDDHLVTRMTLVK